MAKLPSNSPLAGVSGRIGDVVTYVSNGITIVRALPKRRNDHKSSILQQQHLNSFKAKHDFARSIKQSIIDRIWKQVAIPVGMNPYNYFIKSNNDAFGKTDHVEFPQLMILSAGKLLPVENLKLEVANNMLLLSWTSKLINVYASANDRLIIALLSDKKNLHLFNTRSIRSEEKAELELGELNTDIIEGYIFWSSSNDKVFSRSEYWCYRK